ncbi:MAG: Smr/MutS family protein [Acetobacteraceae bacterium]
MRRRVLTERDRAAWAGYVQQVVPLAGVTIPPAPELASTPAGNAPPAPVPAPLPRRSFAPLEVGAAPGGVDRASWTRFRTGKLPALRTLDLHGRTAQRAHAALHDFLAQAIADRLRCVEVITGRGSGEAGGVIRREFPLWLNDPALRPLVLAASHPHPANPGSVRLLLRRVR